MKTLDLQPDQIIVPGEYELANNSILQIYHRVFETGNGDCLPPAIVVKQDKKEREVFKKSILRKLRPKREDPRMVMVIAPYIGFKMVKKYALDRTRKLFERFESIAGNSYYLLDGNHRTTAATLTGNLIRSLEIESDEDILSINRMVDEGELFDFKRDEKKLSDLKLSFFEYCLKHIDEVSNVQDRVKSLVKEKKLPNYIVDRYLSNP